MLSRASILIIIILQTIMKVLCVGVSSGWCVLTLPVCVKYDFINECSLIITIMTVNVIFDRGFST